MRITRARQDPDRSAQCIVTFQIEATGGSGEYQYFCGGVKLSGSSRDRPSVKSGPIIESYNVTSSDGQTVAKKFFCHSRDFPAAT